MKRQSTRPTPRAFALLALAAATLLQFGCGQEGNTQTGLDLANSAAAAYCTCAELEMAAPVNAPAVFGDVGCVEARAKAQATYDALQDKADPRAVAPMTQRAECDAKLKTHRGR